MYRLNFLFLVVAHLLAFRTLQQQQLKVIFYFRFSIMGSGVGLSAREIRLAMAVLVES